MEKADPETGNTAAESASHVKRNLLIAVTAWEDGFVSLIYYLACVKKLLILSVPLQVFTLDQVHMRRLRSYVLPIFFPQLEQCDELDAHAPKRLSFSQRM